MDNVVTVPLNGNLRTSHQRFPEQAWQAFRTTKLLAEIERYCRLRLPPTGSAVAGSQWSFTSRYAISSGFRGGWSVYQQQLHSFGCQLHVACDHRCVGIQPGKNRPAALFKWATKVAALAVERPAIPTTKELVSLKIGSDVLAHFQGDGPGSQERINDTLRAVMNVSN